MSRNISFLFAGLCVLLTIAVLSVILVLWFEQRGLMPIPVPQTQTVSPTPANAETLAQQASESANLAASVAGSIMSFIQSIGALLGLGLIGAVVGAVAYVLRMGAKLETELNKLEQLNKEQARSHKEIRALTLLQLSEQQITMRNFKTAQQLLEEAYHIDDQNAAVNHLLAEIYLREYQKQNNLERAIDLLERVINNRSKRYSPAEAVLGYAYRLKGEQFRADDPVNYKKYFAKAEATLLEALADNPNLLGLNGQSWYGALGSLYRQKGQYDEAIQCYKEADRITRGHSYPINNLALLYYRTGRPEYETYFKRAGQVADKAIEADPFDVFAYFDLLTAQLALGQPESAHETLKTALELKPSSEDLSKLKIGLTLLKESPQPPDGIDLMMSEVPA